MSNDEQIELLLSVIKNQQKVIDHFLVLEKPPTLTPWPRGNFPFSPFDITCEQENE